MKKIQVDLKFGDIPIKGTIIFSDGDGTIQQEGVFDGFEKKFDTSGHKLASEAQKFKMRQLGIVFTSATTAQEAYMLIKNAVDIQESITEPLKDEGEALFPWEQPAKKKRGRPRKVK